MLPKQWSTAPQNLYIIISNNWDALENFIYLSPYTAREISEKSPVFLLKKTSFFLKKSPGEKSTCILSKKPFSKIASSCSAKTKRFCSIRLLARTGFQSHPPPPMFRIVKI